jgi:hypothetical protein
VRDLPPGLSGVPSKLPFGSIVPKSDTLILINDVNGIMGQIQQLFLKLLALLKETAFSIVLHAASFSF